MRSRENANKSKVTFFVACALFFPNCAYTSKEEVMNTFSDRVRFERYRLVVISSWPDSEAKRAALKSASAALEGELALIASRRAGEPVVGPLAAA